MSVPVISQIGLGLEPTEARTLFKGARIAMILSNHDAAYSFSSPPFLERRTTGDDAT